MTLTRAIFFDWVSAESGDEEMLGVSLNMHVQLSYYLPFDLLILFFNLSFHIQ
jgi:hypothetical protein